MSNSTDEENGTYRLFWVELHIPVIDKETDEQKTERLDTVKKMVVDQLADNMIAAGVVDINMQKVEDKTDGAYYSLRASAVLTNPCSVPHGDNLSLKRLQNYGENYPFNSEEDQIIFNEVLDSMQHEPITRH